MAYISQITLPSSSTYILKDAELRAAVGIKDYAENTAYSKNDYLFYNGKLYIVNADITSSANTQFSDVNTTETTVNDDINAKYNELKGLIAGGVHYRGKVDEDITTLYDGASTNPIAIQDGSSGYIEYTAVAGDLVIQDEYTSTGTGEYYAQEYIFDGDHWNELGYNGVLGDLAFADSATAEGVSLSVATEASYTPEGSIEVTLTDASAASDVLFTRDNYTPAGEVSVSLNALTQTPTAASVTRGDYTPSGSIEVTNPTVTISTDAQVGDVSVITGVAAGGTDTLNKVSAGTAVAVATTDTAVAVAYQMKNTTGYATSFTTNGIKDVAVATETTSPEFSVPTNAISGGTISTDATTGSAVVTGVSVAEAANSLFYGATVRNETLSFSTAALSTGKLGFTGTAATSQGYKLSKTNADTANVGVDTKDIIPAKSNGTITPVTVGDSVTVIKNSGLSSAYVKATATNGAASFTGNKETGLKVTSVEYDKATANGATGSFTGTPEENLKITSGTYYKQVVDTKTFTGTPDTISSTGTATGDVTVYPDSD